MVNFTFKEGKYIYIILKNMLVVLLARTKIRDNMAWSMFFFFFELAWSML